MSWVLVTGGAKGLGAAICRALIAQGLSVVIHYRTSERGARALAHECGERAACLQGDLATKRGITAFLKRYRTDFPKTKGIVNNVGNFLIAPLSETEQRDLLELMQTNLFAPFTLTQALLPSLKKQKGHVVNIGTVGLHALRANTYAAAYHMTKVALWSLTLSWAKELAPEGVTVNMVSPGVLETAVDLQEQRLPMGRPATLEETARTVAHFFKEENSYLTGQNVEVAGGFAL